MWYYASLALTPNGAGYVTDVCVTIAENALAGGFGSACHRIEPSGPTTQPVTGGKSCAGNAVPIPGQGVEQHWQFRVQQRGSSRH